MEVPLEEDDDERGGDDARDGQLVGEGSSLGENTSPVGLFSKVLVANRGEIAIRIFRTLRELEIGAVAVYSEADRGALHVRRRRRGVPARRRRSGRELPDQERILEAARAAGAEAVHPGYGFLAENADFARAVEAAGLTWIGPPPEAIEAMGSKTEARERMQAAGVPIIPGTTEPVDVGRTRSSRLGDELGWPLAIKASAGGGGKGFRVVRRGRRRRARLRDRAAARARRTSPTRPSTSSATSRIRATSRCRCSPTRTAT